MPNRVTHNRFGIPFMGFGLGLRTPHIQTVIEQRPSEVDWFELITENYLEAHAGHLQTLSAVGAHYPLYLHGVGLSIGSTDPLDEHYLNLWLKLIARINPVVVSDHLCWTGVDGLKVHDLLPVIYNQHTLNHIADRIKRVQDRLGRVLALENPSTYLEWQDSSLSEVEFLAELSERADCALLLDVNNVFVSCFNHGWDAEHYLATIPADRVVQIHLAGHSEGSHHRIDTHDAPIIPEVFALYESAIRRTGPVSTMIERDGKIPPLAELLAELAVVKQHFARVWGSTNSSHQTVSSAANQDAVVTPPQSVSAATPLVGLTG
jgi:uncharacterized protein